MLEWQKRQKHSEDIKSLGPKEGVVRAEDGFMIKWDGAKVQDALRRMGHDAIGYDRCKCSREVPNA